MGIDLLSIEPTKISSDLASKFILIYGESKVGKTSFATQIPNSLLLAFEQGYHALNGVMAVDIDKWSTFKDVVRQLGKEEVKDKYQCVVVDTATIAYSMCEQFICATNGVKSIGEIGYGKGYAETKHEFAQSFQKIAQMGYGIVFISHAEKRIVTDSQDNEIKVLSPDLQKRAAQVIEPMVDIMGMIDCVVYDDGTSERWLYTRKTPTIMAGSRWKYLDPKIPFGYNELIDAIDRAIAKEVEDGAQVTNEKVVIKSEELDYNAIRAEAEKLWKELVGANEKNAQLIIEKAAEIFGHEVRLSEITASQVEPFNMLLMEMREMAK